MNYIYILYIIYLNILSNSYNIIYILLLQQLLVILNVILFYQWEIHQVTDHKNQCNYHNLLYINNK